MYEREKMNILQLNYFIKVVETKNITKAAESLYISQPSLSQTIKSLENELNVKLFKKDRKGISLTPEGQIFQKYAYSILKNISDAKKELADFSNNQSTITLSVKAATSMIPDIINKFKIINPEINVVISQQDINDTMSDSDLFVYSSTSKINQNNGFTLLTEDCFVGMSPLNPLANVDTISPEMLTNEKFITMPGNLPLNLLTHELCQHSGFSPNIILEVDNKDLIFSLVSINMGITLVPIKTWSPFIKDHNIILKKLNTKCVRYINLQWKNDRYISKNAELMKSFLNDFFKL